MERLDYTKTILHAIDSPKMLQSDIAVLYLLLLTRDTHASIPTINSAIIERWSVSGLQAVKKLAWHELECRFPDYKD